MLKAIIRVRNCDALILPRIICTVCLLAFAVGLLTSAIQIGIVANYMMSFFATLGMASDAMSKLQNDLLFWLPVCTLIGACLIFFFPTIGGIVMLTTAASYFFQLPGFRIFEVPGTVSAIPGTLGIIAGALLWWERRSVQPGGRVRRRRNPPSKIAP
jgi:hypothetical protein